MKVAIIALVLNLLEDFILNTLFYVIDTVITMYMFLPTDPFKGILSYADEAFYKYMPYVNWFIPFDYVVTLLSVFLDAYGTYIVWKYVKRLIGSVLGSGGGLRNILNDLFLNAVS